MSTPTHREALEPCPFCGGTAEMDHNAGYAWWQASCTRCGVSPMEVGTEAEAVAAWNRRASRPEPQAGEAKLREALETIADWRLPPTGKFWDEDKTSPTSYEAEYGSNGAREYMRAIARAALSAEQKGGDRA